MKNVIVTASLALAVALPLAGCGGKTDAGANVTTSNSEVVTDTDTLDTNTADNLTAIDAAIPDNVADNASDGGNAL